MKKSLCTRLLAFVMALLVLPISVLAVSAGEIGQAPSEEHVYAEDTSYSFDGKVTVVEFTVPVLANGNGGDIPIAVLEKVSGAYSYYCNLIYADLETGELSVSIGGENYILCNEGGKAHKLSSGEVAVAIVYDDNNGTARYFINNKVAYLDLDGELSLAVDVELGKDFGKVTTITGEAVKLFLGYKNDSENAVSAEDYKLKLTDVNSDDAVKLIGFQDSTLNAGIRLIAGVDTLYYTSMGFEIESFVGGVSTGTHTITGNTVYSSIVADGKVLGAEEYGYNYLTAAVITDVAGGVSANSFIIVRSFAEIEGVRHYDDAAMIAVSDNGYYFVSDEILYENNFNSLSELPIQWVRGTKSASAGVISLNNDELCLDGCLTGTGQHVVQYYLNRDLGSNYVVQSDFRITSRANVNRWVGLMLRATDSNSFLLVGVRFNGGWFIEEYSTSFTNGYRSLATGNMEEGFALGQSYTISAACYGNTLSLYFDGELVKEVSVSESYTSGGAGIMIGGVTANVDNFVVKSLTEKYDGSIIKVSEDVADTRYEYFETVKFEENFDGLTALPEGWEQMTAVTATPDVLKMSAEDGYMVISDKTSGIVGVTYDQIFSGDYSVEAEIMLTDRSNENRYMGILIGVQDDGSFVGVQFRLSDGRMELNKWDYELPGEIKERWVSVGQTLFLNDKLPLEMNRLYNFKLVCSDGYATAYIDGVDCGGFTIPEKNLSGKIGIITSQAVVKVDSVKVSDVTEYELKSVYSENFDTTYGVPGEWVNAVSSDKALEMSIDDGKLALENQNGRSIVALNRSLDGDFIYEADLTMTERHRVDVANMSWWLGPVFGVQDDGTYVLFDANVINKNWSVTPWNGKGWDAVIIKAANSSEYVSGIGVGVTLKFKFVCFDGYATISVNGDELCSFEIPEKFRSGKVGIGFRDAVVTVDNVNVYSIAPHSEYVTVYEADFDGLTSVPADWSLASAASDTKYSTLTASADGGSMVFTDADGLRTVVALDREIKGENFIYEADLTLTERFYPDDNTKSWWMGPVLGLHDDGSFIIMDAKVVNGQWYVDEWQGSGWAKPAILSSTTAQYIPTFRTGVTQSYRLTCIDGKATISINGTEICSFDVPEKYLSGKVGFGFRNSTVKVDNVKLQVIPRGSDYSAFAGTLDGNSLSLGEINTVTDSKLSFKFNAADLADSGVITVGHGDSVIKVTNKTVSTYNVNTQLYSAEHGLDISGDIEIVVDVSYGSARARIKRSDNTAFSTQSFAWAGRDGEIFAKSEGVALTNAQLVLNVDGYDNKVWIIGGSDIDIGDNTSWAYYLEKDGLTFIGASNETSSGAIKDFNTALRYGRPEYAVWCMGAGESDSASAVNASWQSAYNEFLALCIENGVTPILTTVPNVSGENHTLKNKTVAASGYRYIDLAGEVSGDEITASEAEAMYNAVLADFAEISEYMCTRIRVATYNTGDFSGKGLARTSEEARVAYYKLIEAVDADLWAFQEDEKFLDNVDNSATEGARPYDALYKHVLPNHGGFFTGTYNGKSFLTHFELYDVKQVYYPAAITSYAPNGTRAYGHSWYLTGKILVDGKEISVVSVHLDWNCKERRATQLKELVNFAKSQEYCIIMGDFNPEDYINYNEKTNPQGHISNALFYAEELALFGEIGMTWANAGEFGIFDTIVDPEGKCDGPWDNIVVSSNIKLVSAERVYVDWMSDHTIVVAEMEIQ